METNQKPQICTDFLKANKDVIIRELPHEFVSIQATDNFLQEPPLCFLTPQLRITITKETNGKISYKIISNYKSQSQIGICSVLNQMYVFGYTPSNVRLAAAKLLVESDDWERNTDTYDLPIVKITNLNNFSSDIKDNVQIIPVNENDNEAKIEVLDLESCIAPIMEEKRNFLRRSNSIFTIDLEYNILSTKKNDPLEGTIDLFFQETNFRDCFSPKINEFFVDPDIEIPTLVDTLVMQAGNNVTGNIQYGTIDDDVVQNTLSKCQNILLPSLYASSLSCYSVNIKKKQISLSIELDPIPKQTINGFMIYTIPNDTNNSPITDIFWGDLYVRDTVNLLEKTLVDQTKLQPINDDDDVKKKLIILEIFGVNNIQKLENINYYRIQSEEYFDDVMTEDFNIASPYSIKLDCKEIMDIIYANSATIQTRSLYMRITVNNLRYNLVAIKPLYSLPNLLLQEPLPLSSELVKTFIKNSNFQQKTLAYCIYQDQKKMQTM